MKKKQQRKETSGNLMKITDGKLIVKEQETTKQQIGWNTRIFKWGLSKLRVKKNFAKGNMYQLERALGVSRQKNSNYVGKGREQASQMLDVRKKGIVLLYWEERGNLWCIL